MKCCFIGTDDVWTTPPFLPNMESVMQIYKHLLHNRSIQTAQRKFQHVYSKQSSLIPPPFGRKNRRANLFSCWPNIALNILLISWHFVCLELIVYAKSRALCCMRAVTWTRKKNSSPRWNHVKISRKLIHKTAHQVWSEFTSPSTPRIGLTQRSNDRVTTPDWWAFFFCIVKFWELSVGIWFPYQTGLTMTGKGSNSRIIRHVSERFRGRKKKQQQQKKNNGSFSYATRCKWWWSGFLKFST